MEQISEDTIRSVVLAADAEVVGLFRSHFGEEIELAIKTLAETYQSFQRQQGDIAPDERSATVQMFVHTAINSVITSLHHLVHGYPIASGHMMRHFVESIAMAMLCADDRTGVYQRYRANRLHFDVNSALHLITKKANKRLLAESLGFDAEAWATILEMVKLYDTLSHASVLALGFQMLFTEEGGLIVGAGFDPEKTDQYRSDFVRRRTAAESLRQIVPIILGVLPPRPKVEQTADKP